MQSYVGSASEKIDEIRDVIRCIPFDLKRPPEMKVDVGRIRYHRADHVTIDGPSDEIAGIPDLQPGRRCLRKVPGLSRLVSKRIAETVVYDGPLDCKRGESGKNVCRHR